MSNECRGPAPRAPIGFFNVYKPVGPGSQSLLGPLRKLTGTRRAGHAGTLDPFASGVLPIAVGRATRLIDRLHEFPKKYIAELRFGVETTTGDIEGEVMSHFPDAPLPAREEIVAVLPRFVGTLQQAPPIYSAVKVGGRRAYELARSAEKDGGIGARLAAPLQPRTVVVHSLTLLQYRQDRLTIEVTCSSGTYIRALGRDIAAALGAVAHLTRLVRTLVGPFGIAEAMTVLEIQQTAGSLGVSHVLYSPEELLRESPAVCLDATAAGRVASGAPVEARGASGGVRGYRQDGSLLGALRESQGQLYPRLLLE